MIEGALIKMGGKDWIVPPLSFKQIKTVVPKLNAVQKKKNAGLFEYMDAIVEIIHAATSRNYPDVTIDELEGMVDQKSAPLILASIMEQSGVEQGQPGE